MQDYPAVHTFQRAVQNPCTIKSGSGSGKKRRNVWHPLIEIVWFFSTDLICGCGFVGIGEACQVEIYFLELSNEVMSGGQIIVLQLPVCLFEKYKTRRRCTCTYEYMYIYTNVHLVHHYFPVHTHIYTYTFKLCGNAERCMPLFFCKKDAGLKVWAKH